MTSSACLVETVREIVWTVYKKLPTWKKIMKHIRQQAENFRKNCCWTLNDDIRVIIIKIAGSVPQYAYDGLNARA